MRDDQMTKLPHRQLTTEAIHAGELHDGQGAHVTPIYQTSTFTFASMEAVEKRASGEL